MNTILGSGGERRQQIYSGGLDVSARAGFLLGAYYTELSYQPNLLSRGVPKFAAPLAWKCPEWLGPNESRPPGPPLHTRWLPAVTFVSTFIDLQNALVPTPGAFDSGRSGAGERTPHAPFRCDRRDLLRDDPGSGDRTSSFRRTHDRRRVRGVDHRSLPAEGAERGTRAHSVHRDRVPVVHRGHPSSTRGARTSSSRRWFSVLGCPSWSRSCAQRP